MFFRDRRLDAWSCTHAHMHGSNWTGGVGIIRIRSWAGMVEGFGRNWNGEVGVNRINTFFYLYENFK